MTRRVAAALVALCTLAGCAQAKPGGPVTTPVAHDSAPAASTRPASLIGEPSEEPLPPENAPAPAPETVAVTGQGEGAAIAGRLMPDFMAYWAAADQVLQAGGAGAPTQAMRDTMAGGVLAQWTQQAANYAAKGYKQAGATRVESFSPGGVDAGSSTSSVDFCANQSAVTVTDGSGKTVPPADPTKRMIAGTAQLAYSGGRWRVTQLTGITPLAGCP